MHAGFDTLRGRRFLRRAEQPARAAVLSFVSRRWRFVPIWLGTALLCLGAAIVSCPTKPEPATLVLLRGHIVTMDEAKPEAQALAARGDVIIAVGTNDEIAKHVTPATRVIDLRGQLAIPAFIESHGHFMSVGHARMVLDLTKAKNWDEIARVVATAAKAAKAGEWIIGRGWHQEKWDRAPEPSVEGFPTHDAISTVSLDNPVLLTHASGHATFANANAMRLAGVTRETPDPPGGDILKDAGGQPIGVFRETASGVVRRPYEQWRRTLSTDQMEAEARREIELATEEALSKGIASFHDAGVSFDTVDLYRQLADEHRLGLRLYVMIRAGIGELTKKLGSYRLIDYGDKRLTVRAIKLSLDGALGSRGAWLIEPYADLPTSTGMNTTPIGVAKDVARLALEHGYQLCVHAIGDRANREALDIFEAALAPAHAEDRRWRVEHAQHLHPSDIPRFGTLGVIAAMQGVHCTSDAPFVLARLGQKRSEEGAYVWQKLLQSGAVVTNGTDAPVEDVDPIASYYASVTRRLTDGTTFYPEQRMTRLQALKTYTINGAFAAFEEKTKGSLARGKLADITVLTKDITSVPEPEILTAQVAYTIVGGTVAYQR
jgi:predicted amidohydrolase YtcJ